MVNGFCKKIIKTINHSDSSFFSYQVSTHRVESNMSNWWCSFCKFEIYAHKDKCGKCGKGRPGAVNTAPTIQKAPMQQQAVVRDGDWECVKCKVNNYASRPQCFKCKAVRQDGIATSVSRECVICMTNGLEIIFLPCGHVCTCAVCAPKVQTCPACRAFITEKKRAFV